MRYGDLTRCPDCGAMVSIAAWSGHRCLDDRQAACGRVRSVGEADRFEQEFARYLSTARGRFEVWYAQRTRARPWSTA
jgi:hypothetical protein